MEGKFKHNKNGKFESRYSEEFKRKAIPTSAGSSLAPMYKDTFLVRDRPLKRTEPDRG